MQLCLPQMGILSRCEASWPLYSITASEVAVWALQCETGRLVVRAGLKYSPVGLDWVEVVYVRCVGFFYLFFEVDNEVHFLGMLPNWLLNDL